MGQAWYLSKEGRRNFGKRAAERDTLNSLSPFERVHYLADRQTAKQWAEVQKAGAWWRDAWMWVGGEIEHDPTHNEAIHDILKRCSNAQGVLDKHDEIEQMNWRGDVINHLIDKAQQSREEARQVDIEYRRRDRERKRQREVAAVLAEAYEVISRTIHKEPELTPSLE